MVTRSKVNSYELILVKMYWYRVSNISGNVLKIVIDKNVAKFRKSYGNMYGNGYGNRW